MEYIILPLAPVLLIIVFMIFLGIVGIAGLASVIVPILDQYFVHIIVFFFGLIILACIVLIIIAWLLDVCIYDKIFFSVNLLVSAVISFPLFYMFFLEFCCSYGMGVISFILSIIESVIGIVIAGFIFIMYLGACMLLYCIILALKAEFDFKFIGIVQIILYMILTSANIFIVYHFYKFCLHLLMKYYINSEALEFYKNTFSPVVYDFMCFCRDLYEKIN